MANNMAEERMRIVRRVIPAVVMLQKEKQCSYIMDGYFKSVKQRRVLNKTEESKYIVTDGYQRLPIVTENEATKATRLVYCRELWLPTKFLSLYQCMPMAAEGYQWHQLALICTDGRTLNAPNIITTLASHADMCGRTACTLAPDDLCKSCQYTDKKGRQQKPAWKDAPNGKSYYPSYNIAPGAYTPVLLSSSHFSEGLSSPRVIQPMQWGLIPSWHKGAAGDKSYETNNCRAESMLEKMTYKVPLQKGRRCVVLAEGFFEWKREKESKQPYFIYFPQNTNNNKECETKGDEVNEDGVKVKVEVKDDEEVKVKVEVKDEEEVKVKVEVKDENSDCNLGVGLDSMKEKLSNSNDTDSSQYSRLLTMAGVFDIWTPPGESSPVYSYSVITVESSEAMSWIHHRMPAILTSDDEIEDWLNFGEVPLNKAAKLIRAVTCIESHPVSSVVNNSRNKTPDCVKKIDLSKPKTAPGSAFMSAWLKGGQKVKVEGQSNKKEGQSVKQKSAGNNMMSSWLNRGQKVKVEDHRVKREGDFEDDVLQSPDKRMKIT